MTTRLCYSYLFLILFVSFSFFFFNDTATTEIYTLSLHDALPICLVATRRSDVRGVREYRHDNTATSFFCEDRKSTRLNSSHLGISYAVFCLKKKKKKNKQQIKTKTTNTSINRSLDEYSK